MGDEPTEPVEVLLVDDNRQWAEFIAGEIERTADELAVTVVTSANEAMVRLRDGDAVDCVVTDYRMPEVDGLQLLTRFREEYPYLPLLLITAEGSEDVAARAIEAGVTDYLLKNPRSDQAAMFVTKIRTAVEQYRLQQAVIESEERYRTVTEQNRDGIVIIQNGRLEFANRRFVELTGQDAADLNGRDVVDAIVHQDDRAAIRRVIKQWADGTEQKAVHETRIKRSDGDTRSCEFTGRAIAYGAEQATLVSIRDVTARKQRERELEWERELNRAIQTALVESRTREALEAAVAAQLHGHGYAMVWFAEQYDGRLQPRVIEGEERYVDALDWSVGDGSHEDEPSVWAARSAEPRFVNDFTELFPTAWVETATKCGYRSGAALPLTHNEVSYGQLSVYHDHSNQFDETERRLLTELAGTVAFAVHSLETETALASETTVEATIRVEDGYYLTDLAQDGVFVDCASVRVRGTVPHGADATIQYLTVEGGDFEDVRAAVGDHPSVTDVVVIEGSGTGRFQVTSTGPVPEAKLADRGVVVRSTAVRLNGATITIELPARDDVRSTVDALSETFPTVRVQSVAGQDTDSDAQAAATNLTEKQATALEAAYHHGYFEQPRRSSASEVAASLGIAHSTFLQHLRVAQRKVFERRFK